MTSIEFVPPTPLKERIRLYREAKDKDGIARDHGWFAENMVKKAVSNFNSTRDMNPLLRESLRTITNTFGSGVSAYFYDWRWLLILNLVVWAVWFPFTIFVWIEKPPKFADSTPPNTLWWNRKDVGVGMLFKGAKTSNHAMLDSFFLYTGYTKKMGSGGTYPMGPIWVALIIGASVLLFVAITQRLLRQLRRRRVDPDVAELVKTKESGLRTDSVGEEAQRIIFSYDHSSSSAEGQVGSARAFITALEGLVHATFRACYVPMRLDIGKETYEVPASIHKVEQFRGGSASLDDAVPNPDRVYRVVKDSLDVSTSVPSDKELQVAFEVYLAENPDAKRYGEQQSIADQTMSAMTDMVDAVTDIVNEDAQRIAKCILAYGNPHTLQYATAHTDRIKSGTFLPKGSWLEAAEPHRGTRVPSFLYSLYHDQDVDVSERCKQFFGILFTIVLLVATWGAVLFVCKYSDRLTKKNSFIVPIILVMVKTVIPGVVKFLVQLEGWTSDVVAMQWTLGRTYCLKMASLLVLVKEVDSMAVKADECVAGEAGLYFYSMVLTNSLSNMVITFLSYWAMKRFYGKKIEYDHQTVAQNYIDLNYNIFLVWVGYIYSPMLPLIAAVLYYLELKVAALTARMFMTHAERPFTASPDMKILVMSFFMLTFFLTLGPVCLFLYKHPSTSSITIDGTVFKSYCGPIEVDDRRFQVLFNLMLSRAPELKEYIGYATSPTLMVCAMAFLTMVIVYNMQAADTVREECSEVYVRKREMRRNLRIRRLENSLLKGRNSQLEEDIGRYAQEVEDLEAAMATLQEELKAKGLSMTDDGAGHVHIVPKPGSSGSGGGGGGGGLRAFFGCAPTKESA